MAFQLANVVPWGRNFAEYQLMFQLTRADLLQKIAGFGDGPASFNCEATQQGCSVTSFDPVYQFTVQALRQRIDEVRQTVMAQMAANQGNYNWTHIRSLDELERLRMDAMTLFLSDFDQGKRDGRYLCQELPGPLPYDANAFDLGLSSHFLLLYPSLGYEFHLAAIAEMLRVCKEVRIFPIVDLDGNQTTLTADVIKYFRQNYAVEIRTTSYEFQKGGNQLLVIQKP